MNFAKTGALLFLPCALSACAHLATDEAPPQPAPVAEVSAPVAPAPKPIDFDDALARTTQAYDSTGMVAAVSKDGETIWQGARGLAEEGTDRPVTQDMLFPIASISKAFTATALAILVDRGEVGADPLAARPGGAGQQFGQLVIGLGPDHEIDGGLAAHDFLALGLGDAAGNGDGHRP